MSGSFLIFQRLVVVAKAQPNTIITSLAKPRSTRPINATMNTRNANTTEVYELICLRLGQMTLRSSLTTCFR